MKKFIIVGLIIVILLLSSCGNKNYMPGNYSFNRVHILTHDGHDVCVKITSWKDYDVGIEVHTAEYGSLFLSEGTYILCEDKCPLCEK